MPSGHARGKQAKLDDKKDKMYKKKSTQAIKKIRKMKNQFRKGLGFKEETRRAFETQTINIKKTKIVNQKKLDKIKATKAKIQRKKAMKRSLLKGDSTSNEEEGETLSKFRNLSRKKVFDPLGGFN